MKLKYICAGMGGTVILGNLAIYWSPGFDTWMVEHSKDWVGVLVFLILFLVWGGGLTGLFAPFVHLCKDDRSATRSEWQQAWCRFNGALSLGGLLAWLCIAAVEARWDWSKGASIVTLQFFTTWSFAAAICLTQEILPLPNYRG